MQRLQHRVLLECGDVAREIQLRSNHGPQIKQFRRSWPVWIDCILGHAPRIHILSRLRRFDGQKRFALVIEGGGDWSLEQTIERQEVLYCGLRTAAFVELFECAI